MKLTDEARAIELKSPPKTSCSSSSRAPSPESSMLASPAEGRAGGRPAKPLTEQEKMRLKQQFNESWLNAVIGKYPAKLHARKVAKELDVPSGLIFLPGQLEKTYEDSDMGPAFRQRRYFYYVTGADFAGCSATYDIARDHLVLWIPYTDPKNVLWFGRTPTIAEARELSTVDDVRLASGLDRFLFTALSPGSTLFLLHADQSPKLDITKGVVHIDTVKLKPAMDAARVIKTEYEIAMIRRANAVSSGAHRAVLARVKKLSNEREIDAIFRGFCTAQGAKRQAYPVIAGSGPNAATLHYGANDQPLTGRQLVCLDAGAEWRCYAADITRTFPISGVWSTEAAAIHSIVERMQTECIQRVRPGVVYATLHLHACIVAVTELLRLGILHGGTAAEIFNRGTVTAFFPHGLGHHVGLEVHDVSGRERLLLGAMPVGNKRGAAGKRQMLSPEAVSVMYREALAQTSPGTGPRGQAQGQIQGPPPREKQRLEKNMVFTIEPGL